MAKSPIATKGQNSSEENTSPIPALWNPEDLASLASEQNALAAKFEEVLPFLKSFQERLTSLEADVAILNPSRMHLPAQVVGKMEPHQLYCAILQGTLIALVQGSGSYLLRATPEKGSIAMIKNALDFCKRVFYAEIESWGIKPPEVNSREAAKP